MERRDFAGLMLSLTAATALIPAISKAKEKDEFFPLSSREQIVVLNKIDLLGTDQAEKLKLQFKKKFNVDVFTVSAVTGKNMKEFLGFIAEKIMKSKEIDSDANSIQERL